MIQSENLTKRFNNTLALDSLTTSIEDGKIYGLVGSPPDRRPHHD